MTRIVIAQPHFTYPGGSSAVALETAQRLAVTGYDVHIVSLQHLPELTAPYTKVQFHDLGGPLSSDLGYWLSLPMVHRRFHNIVDRLQPEALLAHVFPANYWAFTYRARHPDIPCVWYCHEPSAFVHDWNVIAGTPWPMRAGAIAANPLLQLVDRLLVGYADAIVCNSPYTATRVEHIYHRTATVANPGVDGERFTPAIAKERLVLAVGRLTRFKRFDLLIWAAATLRARGYDDVRWVIAGDGEEAAALRRLAKQLGADQYVVFAGRLSAANLLDLYERALIVAVTSIGEPFGIVPVEAMAAGTAVVCSDTGGPATTVRNGVTGLHFRSGDVADFAQKLAQLLDHQETAAAMGRQGRALASEAYTWEHTVNSIGEAIERTLSNRRGPFSIAISRDVVAERSLTRERQ